MKILSFLVALMVGMPLFAIDKFPDGTPVSDWFRDVRVVNIDTLGKQYNLSNYQVVNDSTLLQTEAIQAVIDKAAANGGGVIVIPKGTYLSGSLFFKPKTHLYLEEGAVLKGSDDISHFPIVETRIEGQSLKYFAALINADKVDGFTISGKGTVNGNGLRYWKSFWLRRAVIPKCTNMDELRPRLVYISHSNEVQISGVHFKDSPFWTTHFYRCRNVKLLNLRITSPYEPVKAPSTDAVDIDACTNFLIKNCYMAVNDDAVALKGGKGPWADTDENNGANENIIIEDCTYGFCHSALTCGSECIHARNIIFRRCTLEGARAVLWLKMRPDTPQHYEYILVDNTKGKSMRGLYIQPWTQFFDLKGRTDLPVSNSEHITLRNLTLDCNTFFSVKKSDKYRLTDFTLENIQVTTDKDPVRQGIIDGLTLKNVNVTVRKQVVSNNEK